MRGIGQLFLFAYVGWFFGLCAGAWFWVLLGFLALGCTANKVVVRSFGCWFAIGLFVMCACVVCLCCFACGVCLCCVFGDVCLCYSAQLLLLYFACPK